MPEPEPTPRADSETVTRAARWALLFLALAMLVGGVIVKFGTLLEPGSRDFFGGTLLKVGMVVGLAWLAAPQLERLGWQRMRGTGLAIIVVIGFLTVLRPRIGMMAAGIAIGAVAMLAMLGWARGVIFSGTLSRGIDEKSRKIQKNPTRR
ncbi:MAG: hypothetical protein ACTHOU_01040 [Aureliella sp.]